MPPEIQNYSSPSENLLVTFSVSTRMCVRSYYIKQINHILNYDDDNMLVYI